MADLQTRLAALITAIGADMKSVLNEPSHNNQYSASTADQTLGTGDTYVTGSAVSIPTGKIQVKSVYRCKFNLVKTAAGVATPIFQVRVGTAGSTADSSKGSSTFAAQTGVVDEGWIEYECVFRTAGASATIQTFISMRHRLTQTGLSVTSGMTSGLALTGTPFDVTGAGLKIGVSVNAGASSAWTVNVVDAELVNLAP